MANQLTLKIRRPNGEIETVDISETFGTLGLSQVNFARIKAATAAAGKGEVLSWELVKPAKRPKTAGEIAWDRVINLQNAADRIQANGGVSSAIAAHKAAEQAEAEWRPEYPEDAAKLDHKAERSVQRETIARRLAGNNYNAGIEGRD
jgi:hypothetical protein